MSGMATERTPGSVPDLDGIYPTIGAEAAARDDAARDVARTWVAAGRPRHVELHGTLQVALDRLAAAYGVDIP